MVFCPHTTLDLEGRSYPLLLEQMKNIRDHASMEEEPFIEYIEKLASQALRNAKIHEKAQSEEEDYHYDRESLVIETPIPFYRNQRRTPQTPQKRHSNRR